MSNIYFLTFSRVQYVTLPFYRMSIFFQLHYILIRRIFFVDILSICYKFTITSKSILDWFQTDATQNAHIDSISRYANRCTHRFTKQTVVELGFQPALIIRYIYQGCRFALPRAKLSCAFSARGAKLGFIRHFEWYNNHAEHKALVQSNVRL